MTKRRRLAMNGNGQNTNADPNLPRPYRRACRLAEQGKYDQARSLYFKFAASTKVSGLKTLIGNDLAVLAALDGDLNTAGIQAGKRFWRGDGKRVNRADVMRLSSKLHLRNAPSRGSLRSPQLPRRLGHAPVQGALPSSVSYSTRRRLVAGRFTQPNWPVSWLGQATTSGTTTPATQAGGWGVSRPPPRIRAKRLTSMTWPGTSLKSKHGSAKPSIRSTPITSSSPTPGT